MGEDDEPRADNPNTWVLYIASLILVLTGGAFAGLTIALMGQDGIYLQVVSKDPNEPQRKNAKRVYDLLNKGKHWVLVTLLLSNVIVNESLPVVLDRCLGGGVAAVVGSTVLIVIFGEILPQSVCVRYGLQIGGYMSKPVLLLMYLMAPVAWPTAKLLDWLLGEDHGTVYKKSGLKTLVTLHKTLGDVSERLNQDEVTIISAVLDLKAKPVEAVMTPMEDVFTLAEDAILDEKTMDRILTAGYSRIPIHQPGKPTNFVGMLLVRILITYDPEDCKLVSDFALATLPETRPETSCLDILNFFQEGKSHMVLVSEYPGDDKGALGVVTLEDVIEELIGEEIIDESDVYIDIHKAIRRLTPAPKARPNLRESSDFNNFSFSLTDTTPENGHYRTNSISAQSDAPLPDNAPKTTTFIMRRSSAGADGKVVQTAIPLRKNFEEIKEHLKHLGPSNPATNPKATKYAAVKIKHGAAPGPSPLIDQTRSITVEPATIVGEMSTDNLADGDIDETAALLNRPVLYSKDAVQAIRQSYGSIANASDAQARLSRNATDTPTIIVNPVSSSPADEPGRYHHEDHATQTSAIASGPASPVHRDSTDSVASFPSQKSHQSQRSHHTYTHNTQRSRRNAVRSGSITENVVEAGGIRKMVLDVDTDTDEESSQLGNARDHGDKSPRHLHSRANSILGSIIGRGHHDGRDSDEHESDEGGQNGRSEPSHDSAVTPEAGPSSRNSPTSSNKGSQGQGYGHHSKKKNRRKKRKGGK